MSSAWHTEHAACACDACGLAAICTRCVHRGPDARSFLQGYATQDLESLQPGAASFTAFLNSKGRAVFEACVFAPSKRDNTVFLDVHNDCLQVAMTHLRTYKLRADVSVTDASKKYTVLSALPSATGEAQPELDTLGAAFGAAAPAASQARSEHICINSDPRSALLGTKLVVPVEAAGTSIAAWPSSTAALSTAPLRLQRLSQWRSPTCTS